VEVVIEEKAMGAHGRIQGLFASMPKWRMAEIVHQGKRLGKVRVEAERPRNSAGNLRDFDCVGEPVAKVVGVAASENLSLICQAAKGAGVDDPVTVALKVVAIGMRRLWKAASARLFYLHRVGGQHVVSLAALLYLVASKQRAEDRFVLLGAEY
jgi:hypothetical protein